MPTPEEFAARLRGDGFQEVLEREVAPDAAADTHTHPYDARILVLRGAFTLDTGACAGVFAAGSSFQLAAGTAHTEAAGPEGATLLVGRRHPA